MKKRQAHPPPKESSHEDSELFRAHVADATPHAAKPFLPKRTKPAPRAKFKRADEAQVLGDSLDLSSLEGILDNGDHLNYCRSGVSEQILRKLRRGRFSVQAEIDLHGLTVVRAREELNSFLAECRREQLGCVRIVHGKGLRSGHAGPVLKSKVAVWLRQAVYVVAYTSARPVDGGTGALYVLLERIR
ncbi:MAG: Smr/MutS family protein [Gammaproteobacteria bacterium]|nr:Smr/MutS family protein [Gammaproteobacteria bacterium]